MSAFLDTCRTRAERKLRRLAEAEGEAAKERAFHAYGKKMRAVTEFRYLGANWVIIKLP